MTPFESIFTSQPDLTADAIVRSSIALETFSQALVKCEHALSSPGVMQLGVNLKSQP